MSMSVINKNLLRIFNIQRHGFKSSLKIGEIFEFESNTYVIIHAFDMKLFPRGPSGSPLINAKVVVQDANIHPEPSKYKQYQYPTKTYDVAKLGPYESLEKVGEVRGVIYKGKTYKEEVIEKIIDIDNFKYEFTNLKVTYVVEIIKPWSKYEIDQAVKKHKLSKFKIVN